MKKFLSALMAVVCCCCAFFISVSAEEDTYTEENQTITDYAIDAIADYQRLCDGDITVDQFYSSVNQRQGTAYYNTFVDKTILNQMLNDMGIDTQGYFQKYLDSAFGQDYTLENLNGYGAYLSYKNNYGWTIKCYFDYGIVYPDNIGTKTSFFTAISNSGNGRQYSYRADGSLISTQSFKTDFYMSSWGTEWQYYGDIRYSDGTQAPTSATTAPRPSSPSDLTDNQFKNFINQIDDDLKGKQVDLTNLNEVSAEILNKVNNFYNAFTGNDFLTNEHFDTFLKQGKQYFNDKEIAGTLYNVIPKDKNFFQNLTHKDTMLVEYEGKNYYLETDGTLLYKDNNYYFVDMNYFSDDGTLNNEDDSEKQLFDFSQGKIDNAFGTSKKSTLSESAAEVMAKRLKPFMRISVVVKHVVNSIDGNPTQIHAQINGTDYCVVDFAMFDNYIAYIRVLTVGILYLVLGIMIFKDLSKVIANGG